MFYDLQPNLFFDGRLGLLVTTISFLFNTVATTSSSERRTQKFNREVKIHSENWYKTISTSQIKIMIPTRNWCRNFCCNWGTRSHQQPRQNERSFEVLNILSPAPSSTDQVEKENRWDQRTVIYLITFHNILFQIAEDVENDCSEPKEGISEEVGLLLDE